MRIQNKRLLFLFLFFVLIFLLITQASFFHRLVYPFAYRDEIIHYAEIYQLDPYLVAAVIRAESGFKPNALSSKGAIGLMQIMPSTANWAAVMMGLEGFSEEMLLEPRYNIKIGCWYLSNLLQAFQGNRYAALAAYNGGRGEVRRWLQEEIWDGSLENYQDIPFPETRAFLKKVEDNYSAYTRIYARHAHPL